MRKTEKPREVGALRTGVLFLTVANLLVKVLGFAYKVPLNALLGDEMASVNAAAALFAVLYTVMAAGFPGALSLSVARARAVGDRSRVRALLGATRGLLLCVGFFFSLLILMLARPLSGKGGDSGAFLCTVAIAPALFFSAATGVLRGFFQGFSQLVPTAVSELLEGIGKAAFGVVLALLAVRAFGKDVTVGAALAVFGITLGVMLGAAYLALCYRMRGEGLLLSVPERQDEAKPREGRVLGGVLLIALPITASSALMSLSGFLDAQLMRPLLERFSGDAALAKALYSDYSTGALTLYNLPAVLISPIAAALIPFISGAVARGEQMRARSVTATALKLCSVVSLPCALGLSLFSAPILQFVFRSDGDMAENAGPLLSVLAFGVFFAAVLTVTSATLQATGRGRLPIVSLGVGIAVKLCLLVFLVPRIGGVGVPLSTLGFYATASLFNLAFLSRTASLRMRAFDGFLRPFLSALGATLLSRLSYLWLPQYLGEDAALLLAIALCALCYLALLSLFRALKWEELRLLPFADRWLRPVFRNRFAGESTEKSSWK